MESLGEKSEKTCLTEFSGVPAYTPYLGHRDIQHTVRYTDLSAHRFKEFWQD